MVVRMEESPISDACQGLSLACEQACEDVAEKIRSAPLVSVAVAVAAGYVLHSLPAFRLATGASRLLLGLARPALLVFGLLKVAECLRKQVEEGRLRTGDPDRGQQPLLDSPAGPPP